MLFTILRLGFRYFLRCIKLGELDVVITDQNLGRVSFLSQ